jgi:hypothetical protein
MIPKFNYTHGNVSKFIISVYLIFSSSSFWELHSNVDAHKARTLPLINAGKPTNPCDWDWRSHHMCLGIDGNVDYHWMHNAIKSLNIHSHREWNPWHEVLLLSPFANFLFLIYSILNSFMYNTNIYHPGILHCCFNNLYCKGANLTKYRCCIYNLRH